MKLGNCELRENGALDFSLIGPNNVVLRESSNISRCTNTWLNYEVTSTMLMDERREARERRYIHVLDARGENIEALAANLDWLHDILDARD